MIWDKIRFKRKKRAYEYVSGAVSAEYLEQLTADLNFRLLCEAADACQEIEDKISVQAFGKDYKAELLLPPKQILWIESITVTETNGIREPGKQRVSLWENSLWENSLWEWIKNRLLGRDGKKS